jgi:cell wall-associated NlpC family hydrolase
VPARHEGIAVTRVAVAVATLWTAPDRVRPVDAPAVGAPADVRGWIGGLTDEQRDDLVGRTVSQLLLGERVLVLDRQDGWAQVIAVGQPAGKLDPRGYPGWLPLVQLTTGASVPAPTGPDAALTGPNAASGPGAAVTGPVAAVAQSLADTGDGALVVDATATALRDSPDGDLLMPGVILGTRLNAAGGQRHGWLPVAIPGRDEPGWALARDLHPAPGRAPDSAALVETASRLLDVPYLPGGLSAYGIDGAGLVHLVYRRHGLVLPRDANDQADATRPVEPATERPGDLYFFADGEGHVRHVGLVARAPDPDGTRYVLHACGAQRRVVREPVTAARADTLVGVHRLVAS